MKLMIPAVVVALLTFSMNAMAASSGEGYICKQRYALCTSAPCVQIPGSEDKALCSCDVEKGKSFGYSKCSSRGIKRGKHGEREILSTYSFAQAGEKSVLQCPAGIPWTSCLDMPCLVDPDNSKKANCTCKIVRKDSFVTYGGDCDSKNCNATMWSGASLQDYDYGSKVLMRDSGLKQLPSKMCKTD
jgi:hypothetical protein